MSQAVEVWTEQTVAETVLSFLFSRAEMGGFINPDNPEQIFIETPNGSVFAMNVKLVKEG